MIDLLRWWKWWWWLVVSGRVRKLGWVVRFAMVVRRDWRWMMRV
jgi:hypothetical protein